MNKYNFPRPPKRKGIVQINSGLMFSRAFKQALREFAARQSAINGTNVSMSNVIQTSLEQRYPELRARRKQIEKEYLNGKKYLDGIKNN